MQNGSEAEFLAAFLSFNSPLLNAHLAGCLDAPRRSGTPDMRQWTIADSGWRYCIFLARTVDNITWRNVSRWRISKTRTGQRTLLTRVHIFLYRVVHLFYLESLIWRNLLWSKFCLTFSLSVHNQLLIQPLVDAVLKASSCFKYFKL